MEISPDELRLQHSPLDLDLERARPLLNAQLATAWTKKLEIYELLRPNAPSYLIVALAIEPNVPMHRVAQLISALITQEAIAIRLYFLLEPPLPQGLEPIPEALVARLAADYAPPPHLSELNIFWFWNGYLEEQTKRATRWCPTLAWYERADMKAWFSQSAFISARARDLAPKVPRGWFACECNADIEFVLAKHYADLGLGRISSRIASIVMIPSYETPQSTSHVKFQMQETWAQSVKRLSLDLHSFCFEGEDVPDLLSCSPGSRPP